MKTSFGIKRFQEDKEQKNWFGKLLPAVSSMDNCQQEQALEISVQTSIFGDNNIDDHVREEGSPISLTSEGSPESEILSSSCSSSKKKHH